MLSFHCQVQIDLPAGMDPEVRADLLARDQDYLLSLRKEETLVQVLNAVGRPVEFLVFEVRDHAQLHDLFAGRPLFPYLITETTALYSH